MSASGFQGFRASRLVGCRVWVVDRWRPCLLLAYISCNLQSYKITRRYSVSSYLLISKAYDKLELRTELSSSKRKLDRVSNQLKCRKSNLSEQMRAEVEAKCLKAYMHLESQPEDTCRNYFQGQPARGARLVRTRREKTPTGSLHATTACDLFVLHAGGPSRAEMPVHCWRRWQRSTRWLP